jgi:hypothetical protein
MVAAFHLIGEFSAIIKNALFNSFALENPVTGKSITNKQNYMK